MEWLSENWVWLLIGAVFIGMHLFGHGGHGGKGCCGKKQDPKKDDADKHSDHQD